MSCLSGAERSGNGRGRRRFHDPLSETLVISHGYYSRKYLGERELLPAPTLPHGETDDEKGDEETGDEPHPPPGTASLHGDGD